MIVLNSMFSNVIRSFGISSISITVYLRFILQTLKFKCVFLFMSQFQNSKLLLSDFELEIINRVSGQKNNSEIAMI